MKGFSLIEIIIVIGISAVLMAVSVPFLSTLRQSNDFDVADTLLKAQVERARLNAHGQINDDDWGVHVENQQITVFKGDNFTGRTISFDEVVSVPSSIVFSGLSEIVFTKLTAIPNTNGTITITYNLESRDLTINEYGVIEN